MFKVINSYFLISVPHINLLSTLDWQSWTVVLGKHFGILQYCCYYVRRTGDVLSSSSEMASSQLVQVPWDFIVHLILRDEICEWNYVSGHGGDCNICAGWMRQSWLQALSKLINASSGIRLFPIYMNFKHEIRQRIKSGILWSPNVAKSERGGKYTYTQLKCLSKWSIKMTRFFHVFLLAKSFWPTHNGTQWWMTCLKQSSYVLPPMYLGGFTLPVK